MLFAILIIYPFFRKYSVFFQLYIAPILSLILYGYTSRRYERVMGCDRILEAFAGVLLGITTYLLSQKLINLLSEKINSFCVLVIRLYPVLIYSLFILYINSELSTTVQPMLVLLLASGLAVTFSRQGILSHVEVLDNSFVYWLGKISLPIYLVQNFTRTFIKEYFYDYPQPFYYAMVSLLTIICGIIAYYLVEKVLYKVISKSTII